MDENDKLSRICVIAIQVAVDLIKDFICEANYMNICLKRVITSRTGRLTFARCYAAGAEFLKDVPLMKRDGETVKVDDLKNKAIILYFSSGWCGHCRQFTPKLKASLSSFTLLISDSSSSVTEAFRLDYMKWYDEVAKAENIEVVWVSRDREAKDQLAYYNKALPNVPYIPFGDKHISDFLKKYDVKTIPAARLVNSSGEVIEQEVRNRVQDEGQVDGMKLAKEFRSRV
uniref:protein-disulfide reductase n=1 Tax=Setaria digitata TaxID=48799 RepID=A0A915Q4X0_9BILA